LICVFNFSCYHSDHADLNNPVVIRTRSRSFNVNKCKYLGDHSKSFYHLNSMALIQYEDMRLVVQRVKSASVTVVDTKEVVGKIGKGLFILVGVGEGDLENEAIAFAEKLAKMRIMSDKEDKMNLSVKDIAADILCVSQFTLYADTRGGNRPSFIKAAKPETAEKLYKLFVETLSNLGITVQTGKFGAYMKINAVLDGPVTIVL